MAPTDWTDIALMTPHVLAMIFAFAFGASAGSFINVVAWRMPQGISVVSPPSRCPTCGFRLPWYDNLPIVGYLRLRGRCSACGVRFGAHYLVVELVMGAIFVGVYAVLFLPAHGSFWASVGEGWWRAQGLGLAAPGLVVVLCAIAALAAMTLADARTYHIPLAIPVVGSLVAFVGWPVEGLVARPTAAPWPVPVPDWSFLLAGIGGMLGVLAAWVLLRLGWLKESFADYGHYVAEGEVFGPYPHARREVLRELGFLALPIAGIAFGWVASHAVWPEPAGGAAALPMWFQALGACSVGFVAGGAVIWLVRIVVTLLLGVEAMGLGDVHLMACIGAAFGWRAVIVGFVVAPFVGLALWAVSLVRHAPMRVPFGPSLAVGGVAAFLLWPVIVAVFGGVLRGMGAIAAVAREHPGVALGLAGALGAGALGASWRAGRAGKSTGCWAAGAILLIVAGVMAWVFGSPAGVWATAGTGGWLLAAAVASARVSNAQSEVEGGPRTALWRIMSLMVVVVIMLGLFLVFVRSPESDEKAVWSPLQPGAVQVQ